MHTQIHTTTSVISSRLPPGGDSSLVSYLLSLYLSLSYDRCMLSRLVAGVRQKQRQRFLWRPACLSVYPQSQPWPRHHSPHSHRSPRRLHLQPQRQQQLQAHRKVSDPGSSVKGMLRDAVFFIDVFLLSSLGVEISMKLSVLSPLCAMKLKVFAATFTCKRGKFSQTTVSVWIDPSAAPAVLH